jgi:hypothetical protein
VVDLEARRKLAEAARALVSGRISNDEFESRIPESEDPAVLEVYSKGFWLLYGDLSEHRLAGSRRLSRESRQFAARCILFLKSSEEYRWPHERGSLGLLRLVLGVLTLGLIPWLLRQGKAPAFWPFASNAAYEEALENPVYLRGVV